MFLAAKPVEVVHIFLLCVDQPRFLWLLLHIVPSGIGAICPVLCSLHDAEPGHALCAASEASLAPSNMVLLLFLPSQMTSCNRVK